MPEEIIARRREVKLYIDHAYQMLEVATSNRRSGFYASAVNRAYYAICKRSVPLEQNPPGGSFYWSLLWEKPPGG